MDEEDNRRTLIDLETNDDDFRPISSSDTTITTATSSMTSPRKLIVTDVLSPVVKEKQTDIDASSTNSVTSDIPVKDSFDDGNSYINNPDKVS